MPVGISRACNLNRGVLKFLKVDGKGVGDIYLRKENKVRQQQHRECTYLLRPTFERPQEAKDELLLIVNGLLVFCDDVSFGRSRRQDFSLLQVNVAQTEATPIENEEL